MIHCAAEQGNCNSYVASDFHTVSICLYLFCVTLCIAMLLLFVGSLPSLKVVLEIAGNSVIEDRDNQNRSPLVLATMGGHGEVVNFLLSEGGT